MFKVFTAETPQKRKYLLANSGFPGDTSGKESTCQCRRHKRYRFNPWVRKIPWRRAGQPIPVFLPGEPQGQRSLAGYNLQCRKELDTTKATQHAHQQTHHEIQEDRKHVGFIHNLHPQGLAQNLAHQCSIFAECLNM